MTANTQAPLANSPQARSFQAPVHFGYYIVVDGMFYEFSQFNVQWELGLNKLAQVTHAPVEGGNFQLVAYFPDIEYVQNLAPSFMGQRLDVVNQDYVKAFQPRIMQADAQLFILEVPHLAQGDVLIISDREGMHAISMGSVTENLVRVFNETDKQAYEVVDSIKNAMKSYPANPEFPALLEKWEQKYAEEKSDKVWQDVLEKLNNYKESPTREGKIVHAKDVLHEIEYYLSFGDRLPQQDLAQSITEELNTFINTPAEQAPAERPNEAELGSLVTVWRSMGGINFTISMVDLGADVLLRFKGLPNECDGMVYRHKKDRAK